MPSGIPKTRASKSQLVVRNGGKRTRLDIDKDTWYAVQEAAKGRTYKEIAEELNARNADHYSLTSESIRLDIERALVEWKRENMENIDAYIAKELLRIENIEKKVTKDYEQSKTLRPHEYAALMKRGMTIEEIDEMYANHLLGGDPRYLQVLLNLQQQRMRLLGIEKGNDVAQNTIINYNFGDANVDELAKMAEMMQDNKLKELTIDEQ